MQRGVDFQRRMAVEWMRANKPERSNHFENRTVAMRQFLLPSVVFLTGYLLIYVIAEVIADGLGKLPLFSAVPIYALVFALLFPTILAVSMNLSGQLFSVVWTVQLTVISCLLAGGFPLLHDPVLATVYYIAAALVFIAANWGIARFFPGSIGSNPG